MVAAALEGSSRRAGPGCILRRRSSVAPYAAARRAGRSPGRGPIAYGCAMSTRVLVTGATGFIGGQLARRLAAAGHEVRCLVRDRSRAPRAGAGRGGHGAARGRRDWTRGRCEGAGRDIDAAYYLIHSMGRGGPKDFATREHQSAEAFAAMASREGIGRVLYLGGLGDRPESEHLRSRQETARTLQRQGPPLTYFRAGMVVGPESESYRTLRYLVQRLPAMIGPAWLQNHTQPIAIEDTLAYLADGAEHRRHRRARDPDRRTGRAHLRRDARPDGRRARDASAPSDPGSVHHPVAVIAVDRAGHARWTPGWPGRWWRAWRCRPWSAIRPGWRCLTCGRWVLSRRCGPRSRPTASGPGSGAGRERGAAGVIRRPRCARGGEPARDGADAPRKVACARRA